MTRTEELRLKLGIKEGPNTLLEMIHKITANDTRIVFSGDSEIIHIGMIRQFGRDHSRRVQQAVSILSMRMAAIGPDGVMMDVLQKMETELDHQSMEPAP